MSLITGIVLNVSSCRYEIHTFYVGGRIDCLEENSVQISLVETIYSLEQLRKSKFELPQVVFCGRSNVGKSSLINALAERKNLAKVSSTPGKTRSINVYAVFPEKVFLVDIPGYGYAQCSKKERGKWSQLIYTYISSSHHICCLVALLDARLPPQKLDKNLILFAQKKQLKILPVLTKIDKCTYKERAQRYREWEKYLSVPILCVSSKTGFGLPILRSSLIQICEEYKKQIRMQEQEGEDSYQEVK